MIRMLSSNESPARFRTAQLLRGIAPVFAAAAFCFPAWAQSDTAEEPAANAVADVQANVPDAASVEGSPAESAIDDTPQVPVDPAEAGNESGLTPEQMATLFGAPPTAPTADYSQGPDAEGFTSFEQRVSYAIGASMGGQMIPEFAAMDFNVDAGAFGQGFGDAADEAAQPSLTEAQMQETLMQFQMEMQQRQMAKMQESMNADTAFLEMNAETEGVVTTESGVQYTITEKGDGPMPQPTDTVLVHYEGKLLDGTVFDSSLRRGEPVPFPLDGVIPGFQAGLTQMPVGSKGTLFIPGEQAYGMQPPPQSRIGPNQLLIFDVELIEIVEDDMGSLQMVPEAIEGAE